MTTWCRRSCARRTGVIREARNERLVDLERGDRAALQVAQAGIARPEIVASKAYADGAQRFKDGEDRRIAEGDHRFGELDLQMLGGQRRIRQHAVHPHAKIGTHLAGGNIDGQPDRPPTQHLPVVHLASGFDQHPFADLRHQPGRFGPAVTAQASDAASATALPRRRSRRCAD